MGHSWGGILAIEYALKYQQHLKGLIISDMMASIPQYNEYGRKLLMAALDPQALAEIDAIEAAGDYENPRFMELLIPSYLEQHILRMPFGQWPDPVMRDQKHINLFSAADQVGETPIRKRKGPSIFISTFL